MRAAAFGWLHGKKLVGTGMSLVAHTTQYIRKQLLHHFIPAERHGGHPSSPCMEAIAM